MKIRFLIIDAYGRGGTIVTTLNMAEALSGRGHEVEVVSLFHRHRSAYPLPTGVLLRPLVKRLPPLRQVRRRPGALVRWLLEAVTRRLRSRLIHPEVQNHRLFSLWSDLVLWRYLRAQRGGVLVSTAPGLNLAVARFARPDVVTVGQEHLYLQKHRPALQAAIRKWYPRLDAVVTLTQPDAADYRSLLGRSTHITAIPNAIRESGDSPVRPEPAPPVAVAAGRLVPQKGFDLLVRAWGPVARWHPEWTLRIYGEGAEYDRLQAMINRRGLQRQVQLMGFTPDLRNELAAASLFVLSSRYEGFGLVLLEAMASGLSVVAFDCPRGPSCLITHEVDGLLVPPRSVPLLTAALDRTIRDPDLRRALGEQARISARGYVRDAIAERWERLFEQLSGLPGQAAR